MGVYVQIADHLLVRVDDFMQALWCNLVSQPCGRCRYNALGLELVGIHQIPTERLRVIRLVGDVR